MKVRPSVKPMCEKCKIIKRKGKVGTVYQPVLIFIPHGAKAPLRRE